MKKFWIFLILVVCCSNTSASGQLNLFDADNLMIGSLLDVTDIDSADVTLLTPDGYLINFSTETGLIRNVLYDGFPAGLDFETSDCTGQAYLPTNDSSLDWLRFRGGEIFKLGSTVIPAWFAKVEWGQSYEAYHRRSSISPQTGDCNAFSEVILMGTKATAVNPSTYGIKVLYSGEYGFKIPITAVISPPESVFCSGFESCTQTLEK